MLERESFSCVVSLLTSRQWVSDCQRTLQLSQVSSFPFSRMNMQESALLSLNPSDFMCSQHFSFQQWDDC